MCVQRMLLSGLERIQADHHVLGPEYRALAHSLGRVDGVVARVDDGRMLHALILADAKQFNDGKDTPLWIRFVSARRRYWCRSLVWRWKMKSSLTLLVLMTVSISVATVVARNGLSEQAASGAASQASRSSFPADVH